MAFSVQEFKTVFSSGFQKSNLYVLDIAPKATAKISARDTKIISMSCQRCEMPGKSFMTTDHYMFGVKSMLPYQISYLPITTEFICDSNNNQKKFFDSWQSFIANPKSNFMSYYDDYVATITIKLYAPTGALTYKCIIEEAFPLTVNPQSYTATEGNQFQTLQVVFAYRRWLNASEAGDGVIGDSGVEDTQSNNTPGNADARFDPNREGSLGGTGFFPFGKSFFSE